MGHGGPYVSGTSNEHNRHLQVARSAYFALGSSRLALLLLRAGRWEIGGLVVACGDP